MYSITNNADLFKETYQDLTRNHYNSDTAILARVRKRYDLQGIKDHVAIPMGMAGGVGGLVNGYLPEGGSELVDQMEITAKDLVAQAVIDRKSMKAAMTDKGSFVRFTRRAVQKAVESYDTAASLLWHGDGTGRLGKTAATGLTSGTANTAVLQIDTNEFFERWLQPGFQVNIGNAADTGVEDGVFKITNVDTPNKRITVTRQTGAFDVTSGTNADARFLYLQNTFKAAPQGFESTLMATSGNIYSIPYNSNTWGAYIHDMEGDPLTAGDLNTIFNIQGTRVSQNDFPDFGITSPEVWAKLANIWEDKKTVYLSPRDSKLAVEANFGIAGLNFTRPDGKVIPIVQDRHCKRDRLYFLHSDTMYMYHMPDHGWWDDDGQVFLRVPNRPWYAATYGGFYENVIHPTFQVVIDNISLA